MRARGVGVTGLGLAALLLGIGCGAAHPLDADAGCSGDGARVDGPSGPGRPFAELRARVGTAMDEAGAPGWAYAVVRDGEIVTEAGGVRCEGSADRVDENTLFRFGFNAESVTAAAVLEAAADPEVGLGAREPIPLDRLGLGGLAPPPDVGEDWRAEITWHRLLTYTAGFPSGFDGNPSEIIPGCEGDGTLALAEYVPFAGDVTLGYPPGRLQVRDRYSLPVAAHLLAVTDPGGRRFAGVVRARVFDPLGMADARHVPGAAYFDEPRGAPYACGYVTDGVRIQPAAEGHLCETAQPGYTLFLDIEDAARYAAALARADSCEADACALERATMEAMLDWEAGVPSWTSSEAHRSAGFYLWPTDAGTVAYHHSSYFGFGVAIAVVPSQRFAVVGLTNLRIKTGPFDEILLPALDIFLGLTVPNRRLPSARWEGDDLAPYAGCYRDAVEGARVTLALDGAGALHVGEVEGRAEFLIDASLEPRLTDRFVAMPRGGPDVRAWRAEDGTVEALTVGTLDYPLWREECPAP